ncbi:hypothetical protein [Pseudomonas peli]|uniref:hypothetical protein n=1 Tax=Pseudomonas peli TaxID=592361 RepID=UPI002856583E|nr:hypothetical protein [Pseudomonas peli]MDR7025974.1 hypothetical protein [Pseudomonas peli]
MTNKYALAAALIILSVFASYIIKFYFILDYNISSDTAVWGQLGDYAGGLLNPILSFISLVLLIRSLTLQNDANASLKSELSRNEKTEKLRSFENLFFNMISSQKELFTSMKFEFLHETSQAIKKETEAVIEIEDEIERMRSSDRSSDSDIQKYLKTIDSKDQIFNLTRAFYITIKMTSEKLSETQGFSMEDRKSYYSTLISFTNFSQLRLIMISLQFLDYQSVKYLRSHSELNEALKDAGLSYDLY